MVGAGITVTFALSKVTIDPDAGMPMPAIGYDLDDRCTDNSGLPKHEPSCRGVLAVDDVGGIDNAFVSILRKVPLAASDPADPNASALNKTITKGLGGTLVVLKGYDEDAGDIAHLKVGLGALTGFDGDGGTPTFNGTDRWIFDPATFFNGLPLLALDGYVSNGVLVTRSADFDLAIGGFLLSLRSAVLSARIVRDVSDGLLHLREGKIAGRVNADTLIHAAAATPIGSESKPLCDAGLAGTLAELVCAARDVPLDQAADGKNEPCDAVSVGIGFEAVTALVSEAGSPPPPDPCGATPSCDGD